MVRGPRGHHFNGPIEFLTLGCAAAAAASRSTAPGHGARP